MMVRADGGQAMQYQQQQGVSAQGGKRSRRHKHEQPEYHIILSYHRKNRRFVEKVYRSLRNHDIPVWMDTHESAKGRYGAAAIMPFMSQKFQDSSTCQDE